MDSGKSGIRGYPPLTVFVPHEYGPLVDEACSGNWQPRSLVTEISAVHV